jgi:hypothetical protein
LKEKQRNGGPSFPPKGRHLTRMGKQNTMEGFQRAGQKQKNYRKGPRSENFKNSYFIPKMPNFDFFSCFEDLK